MHVNESNLRETMENDIEECQENIREYRYGMRWYRRLRNTFWISMCIIVICFFLNNFLNTPLLPNIGGIAIAIAVVTGLTTLFLLYYNTEELRSYQKSLRKEKQRLTKHQHRLKQYDERTAQQLPTPSQHAERLPSLIANYRK